MTEPSSPPSPLNRPSPWTEDTIFEVMSNHARRRIVKALASGQGRTATDLTGTTGKKLDATIKDCSALTKAGFLQMSPDPVDGRKMRYTLVPSLPITKMAWGWELDFGCCVLRVR